MKMSSHLQILKALTDRPTVSHVRSASLALVYVLHSDWLAPVAVVSMISPI